MLGWAPSTSATFEKSDGTGPGTLKVKRSQVTLDRTWSPYVQGSVVCAIPTTASGAPDQAATAAIDPRTAYVVRTAFGMLNLDTGATSSLNAVGYARSRSADYSTGELALNYSGAESLWQDYLNVSDFAQTAVKTDLQLVKSAIDTVGVAWTGGGAPSWTVTNPDGGSFSVAVADSLWSADASAWDFANGIEEAAGRWLRSDETGAVLVTGADYVANTAIRTLSDADRILSLVDTIDRDSRDYANAVTVRYNGDNPVTRTASGGFGAGPRKTLLIDRPGKRRSYDTSATAYAQRAQRRGRSLAVTAVADLSVRPNQSWWINYLGASWFGKVQSVTFRFPEGLMDLVLNQIDQ